MRKGAGRDLKIKNTARKERKKARERERDRRITQ